MFRSIWRIRVTGVENIPATGGAILTPNHTSVIDSFFLPAAARAGQLCRQGRVSRRLEDSQALSGARHDPDRPQRRRRKPTGARYGRSSSRAATSLRFTRRALDLAPASFTRGTRALLVCRSAPAVRSFRWASRVPGRSNRLTNRCPMSFVPWRSTSARRFIRPPRFGERPAASVASDHR